MAMILAFAAAAAALYYYKTRILVTKEDIKDIDSLHSKLDKEIQELKKNKKNYLIQTTVDDFNEQIFKICNENRNQYQIDLHGLYVEHSLKYLKERIYKLNKDKYKGKLLVITGKGNHSKNGAAKIKPSVESFLNQNNFFFDDNNGSFIVYFDKSKISFLK